MRKILTISIIIICFLYLFSLPSKLFTDPTSTVIFDQENELLGAKIADDGQWRFPHNNMVPEKFKKAIIEYEDQFFYYHPGINPGALVRALIQNIKEKRIVSGGSTLTMQVIRMSRKGKQRTVWQKIIEIILATRLELSASKEEILALYASNAPFGGNVVGLDAAAWRYYGNKPEDLSWGEIASLAVLPNSPSLIHPGRNRNLLLEKRNNLLDKLLEKGVIDSITCRLSKAEELPKEPVPLPQVAPHLLAKIFKEHKGQRIITTLNYSLQEQCTEIIQRHYNLLKNNNIYNLSALVVEVETGNVLVYIGNTDSEHRELHCSDVDIVMAERSSGSILKPVLYALMTEEGMILPNTLIPDVPTHFSGFTPENFNLQYDGAVPAKRALARSLNVPSVKMLQKYGVPKFHYNLQKLGLSTLHYPPDHYGLSLILGGTEVQLWELTAMYSSFSRILNQYNKYNGKYNDDDLHSLNYEYQEYRDRRKIKRLKLQDEPTYLSAGAIWLTYQALLAVNRPEQEAGWYAFSSRRKIAWKTGTSFGYKDAWSIGTTPNYVVAVWAGNADGEGRPGLTGVTAAAPLMFDIFKLLPHEGWFEPPLDEMVKIPVCKLSGYRKGPNCNNVDSMWVYTTGLQTSSCPYHIVVHLSGDELYRVNRKCYSSDEMITRSWFVLPPLQEYYYKSKHPGYRDLPPMMPGCEEKEEINYMDFIYPKHSAKVYIPLEMDGNRGEVVFELAHRKPQTTIFWHLDDEYLGSTNHFHQKTIVTSRGKHILHVVDQYGESIEKEFEVVNEDDRK